MALKLSRIHCTIDQYVTYLFKSRCIVQKSNVIKSCRLQTLSYQYACYRKYQYSSKPQMRENVNSSRYYPTSRVELAEEKISDLFRDIQSSTITSDEWDDIKTGLLTNTVLTEMNLDSVLMNVMLTEDRIDLAHSFMQYLKEIKMKANFLTYLKYMALCSKHIDTCGEDVILNAFKKVKTAIDSSPVLDAKRVECLIQGLCVTSEWRMSFDYLKKLHSRPTKGTRNYLACAALKNDDEPLAWEIITKWFEHSEMIDQSVFKEYFIYLSRFQNSLKTDSYLLKIFKFLTDNTIIVSQAVAKEIEMYFTRHRFEWKIDYTKVNRPSQCSSCKKELELLDLTPEEFKYLKDSFFERAVKKSDVFINTTERELEVYLEFLNNKKPFHIVLDGLNAAHSNHKLKGKQMLAKQLLKVVKMLSKSTKRLLVMGRHHMNYWPRNTMQYINERADMFFTQNVSQDDPFVVYAAMSSGPHTLVLSGDLMRDHFSRLDDPQLILLFRRWQQSHQIFVTVDENDLIKFTGPLEHSIKLQGNMEQGWHIPYDDGIILDPYEELNNWLCIHRLSYRTPQY